jgi:hypothetical protein
MMTRPDRAEEIKNDYQKKIAENGKITDWDYGNFNRWIKNSGRSEKEQRYLYELEALSH